MLISGESVSEAGGVGRMRKQARGDEMKKIELASPFIDTRRAGYIYGRQPIHFIYLFIYINMTVYIALFNRNIK